MDHGGISCRGSMCDRLKRLQYNPEADLAIVRLHVEHEERPRAKKVIHGFSPQCPIHRLGYGNELLIYTCYCKRTTPKKTLFSRLWNPSRESMFQSSASQKRQRRKRPHHGPDTIATPVTFPSSSLSILNPETKRMHRRGVVRWQRVLFVVFAVLLIASPLGGVWAAPSEIEKAVREHEPFAWFYSWTLIGSPFNLNNITFVSFDIAWHVAAFDGFVPGFFVSILLYCYYIASRSGGESETSRDAIGKHVVGCTGPIGGTCQFVAGLGCGGKDKFGTQGGIVYPQIGNVATGTGRHGN